jgi:ABC-type Mn2+/Zn2+ transport system ATPase subunit
MATSLERLLSKAKATGCPADQIENFLSVGYVPQPKQLEFHAAARSADGMEMGRIRWVSVAHVGRESRTLLLHNWPWMIVGDSRD